MQTKINEQLFTKINDQLLYVQKLMVNYFPTRKLMEYFTFYMLRNKQLFILINF